MHLFKVFKKYLFIYLAVPGLSCSTWDLRVSLWHVGYLAVACELLGFPGESVVKNPPANTVDMDSIPGSERSPGGGTGNALQYSCLENALDRGAWWVTVHGVVKSQTWLHMHACKPTLGRIVWGLVP